MDVHDCAICGLPAVRDDWIRTLVANLTIAIPVTSVVMIGSRARDEHLDSSDYDVVVVSPAFSSLPPLERTVQILEAWRGHRGLDAIGITPRELETDSVLCALIRNEGRIVYSS